MKRLFSAIAVISVIAAMGMVMTACGNQEQSSEETTAVQTTAQATTAAQETTAQQTTAAQATTAAQKSDDDKQSSETESKASDNSKADDSSEASEDKSDNGSGKFAGISEEDAKVMAMLDLVTEDPSVESCKQGKDKNGADCWVIILKDADNDRYISYVNAEGSTTLPYTE